MAISVSKQCLGEGENADDARRRTQLNERSRVAFVLLGDAGAVDAILYGTVCSTTVNRTMTGEEGRLRRSDRVRRYRRGSKEEINRRLD